MNILIAEDDDISRRVLSGILTRASSEYQVTAVANGSEAWQRLNEANVYHLGIFDVMMPELDGLGLLHRIRHTPRLAQLPVILCTAVNDRSTVTEAATLGVTRYIVKPFTSVVVLDRVRQVQNRQADSGALENAARVRERLGLDREAYRGLLTDLVASLEAWLTMARRSLRPALIRGCISRANSIKGACLTLGLNGVAVQLTAFEQQAELWEQQTTYSGGAIESQALSDLEAALDRVASELNGLKTQQQQLITA